MGVLALAADERVADVEVSEDELSVGLRDGRRISVPLTWYPRLLKATAKQREQWKISGGGYGIHWEEIDEDLSSEGLLRGAPSARVTIQNVGSQTLPVRVPPRPQLKESNVSLGEDTLDVDSGGILDHLIEGEEASTELTAVLSTIQVETEAFTSKINKHTNNLDRLGKNPGGSSARDYKKVVLLAASDMNSFSRKVNEVIPNFATSTEILDRSYSAYVKHAHRDVQGVDQIRTLFSSLTEMLRVLGLTKQNLAQFRDSTRSIRKQNISRDLNKAADQQWKALDSVLLETERVESFALRIKFLIEERFPELKQS